MTIEDARSWDASPGDGRDFRGLGMRALSSARVKSPSAQRVGSRDPRELGQPRDAAPYTGVTVRSHRRSCALSCVSSLITNHRFGTPLLDLAAHFL